MTAKFTAVEIISAKRDKQELSDDQIDWTIDAYTKGIIADEQMSALLMAILLNGMNNREKMNWSILDRPTVDKHSTGGVGDKITLPLAPLVAACGAAVPQLSGRGLGHTGGTLDKLESIKGWKASISNQEMLKVIQECGAVICAAGSGLAPADKKLYALRDVTGTVQSIPLIASSIMSKKIAEGTQALILDVKTGSGAFMSDPKDAGLLARTMVDLGKRAGVETRALVTAMDVPLGLTVGNSLEVRETLEVLSGAGPTDVVELTLILANEMLDAAKIKPKIDPANALKNGAAMDVWRKMIKAQGGNNDAPLPIAKEKIEVKADVSGKLLSLDALKVGISAWRLGAGRQKQGDTLQHGAGIEIHAKPGDIVIKGQTILTLHSDEPSRFDRASEALIGAFSIGAESTKVSQLPLVVERIED
jgi:thymidine phosphorylase